MPLRVPVRSDIEGTTDSSSSKMIWREDRDDAIRRALCRYPSPQKKILNMSPENAKGSYNNLPVASCFRGGDMLVFTEGGSI